MGDRPPSIPLSEFPRGVLACCPHGDITCPCPDYDPCHYEGPDPMACPNPPRLEERFTSVRIAKILEDGTISTEATEAREVTVTSSFPCAPHCHVEGCNWRMVHADAAFELGACGLRRIAPEMPVNAAYEMGCGSTRRLVEMPRERAPRG